MHVRASTRELRTEALLCLQPQGPDKTPGKGKVKEMTTSVKALRDLGNLALADWTQMKCANEK